MLEILVGVGVCVIMAKIADAEDESPLLWGGITFALCYLGIAFSFTPYVRMMGAGVVSYFLLMIYAAILHR